MEVSEIQKQRKLDLLGNLRNAAPFDGDYDKLKEEFFAGEEILFLCDDSRRAFVEYIRFMEKMSRPQLESINFKRTQIRQKEGNGNILFLNVFLSENATRGFPGKVVYL